MREQEVSDRLGEILKGIYVPEGIARQIVNSLQDEKRRGQRERQQRISGLEQRLSALRSRMDQMYEDKLDGKIDEEFWVRKMNENREQERTLQSQISALKMPLSGDSVLTVQRIFELANRAHFLYLTRNSAERGQLLRSVLLNCSTDGVSFTPTYRKPFDLIFERAKTENWSGREDLNLRPPGPEQKNTKFQVLHLVSLTNHKTVLSLLYLYRTCTELTEDSCNAVGIEPSTY